MLIRYTGQAGRRIIGVHVWERANGYVCEVAEPELCANLLTYPHGGFAVAPDEPLLTIPGIGAATCAGLALCGVATVEALARLRVAALPEVARAVGRSQRTVTAWRRAAREMAGLRELDEDGDGELPSALETTV